MQLTNLLNFSDSIKIVQGDKNIDITHLTSDSRDVQQGSLFVAISGEKVDGHKFINSAISKGAIAILTDGRDVEIPKTISVLTANNVSSSNQPKGNLCVRSKYTYLEINNKECNITDLDVDTLYKDGRMKK